MNYSLEMKIEISSNSEGVSIELRQYPEWPDDLIEIHTKHCKESQEFYGDLSLVLSHQQCDLLIEALQKIKENQLKQNKV